MRSLLLLLPLALVSAQDAERGRCLPEVELRLEACQSGTQDVWHYTYQGPNDRALQRSWPYKSRERAQAAMEADEKLCQTVDRYFDKTDCRTRYGGVFCAGCESSDSGLEWWKADMKHSLLTEIEYWDRVVRRAARAIQKAGDGRPVPNSRFGLVFREWVGQLRAARERVRAIESLLGRVTPQMYELSRMIDSLDTDIRAAEISGQQVEALVLPKPPQQDGNAGDGPQSAVSSLSARCANRLPSWTSVCDQAVNAVFAAARNAAGDELACLREWRAYHQCIGIYAHNSNPVPAPVCTPPVCRTR